MKGVLKLKEKNGFKVGDFITTGERIIGMFNGVCEVIDTSTGNIRIVKAKKIKGAVPVISAQNIPILRDEYHKIKTQMIETKVEYEKFEHFAKVEFAEEIIITDELTIHHFHKQLEDGKTRVFKYSKRHNNYDVLVEWEDEKTKEIKTIHLYLRREQFSRKGENSYWVARFPEPDVEDENVEIVDGEKVESK